MFFEKLTQISQIAAQVSCSIFIVPPSTKLQLKTPLYLRPSEDKTTNIITVEQLRDFLALTNNRETHERFFRHHPSRHYERSCPKCFSQDF